MLGVTIFILRSFVKAALIAILVVFLFRVGWVYTADDVRNNLFINKILNPDYIESVVEKYEDFTEKRKEGGDVIDPEALEDTVKEEIRNKVLDYLNGSTNDGEVPDEIN